MGDNKKDEVVDHFDTYEEYLDTFVDTDDLRYLGEAEIARIIVELGYRLHIAKLSPSQPIKPQLGAELALISVEFWDTTHPATPPPTP